MLKILRIKNKKQTDKKKRAVEQGFYTCLLLFTLAIKFSSPLFSASIPPHVILPKAKKLTYLTQNAHILTPVFKSESTIHTVRHVYPPLHPLTILTTSVTGLLTSFLFHSTHTVSIYSTSIYRVPLALTDT